MSNPNAAQNFREAGFRDFERSVLKCAFCHQGPIDDDVCEGGKLYIYRHPGGAKEVARIRKAAVKRFEEQKKPKKRGRGAARDEVITLDSSDFSESDDEAEAVDDVLCFHYFCVLFSAQIQQRGIRGSERNSVFAQNHAGLFGFLIDDILTEIERCKSEKCRFCSETNANVQCKKKGCKTTFHYQCGESNGAQYVFSDDFPSYCPQHRVDYDKLLPKTKAFPVADKTCLMCSTKVTVPPKHMMPKYSNPDFIIAPCCGRYFKRNCIQKLAMSEGSARFQCPNCGEQSLFGLAMRRCGIYVPIRESSGPKSGATSRPGAGNQNGNGHSPSPSPRGRGRGRGRGVAARGRQAGPGSRAPPSRTPSSSRSSTSPAPVPKLTISKANQGGWKSAFQDDSDEDFNLGSVMKEVRGSDDSAKKRGSRNASKPARFRSPNYISDVDVDDDDPLDALIPVNKRSPAKSFDAVASPAKVSSRLRGAPPKLAPNMKFKTYRDLSSDSSRSPSPEIIAEPSPPPRATNSRGRGRGRGRNTRATAPSPASSLASEPLTSSSRPGPRAGRTSRSARAPTPDPLDDLPLSRRSRSKQSAPVSRTAPTPSPKPSPATPRRGRNAATSAKKANRKTKKDDFSSGESSGPEFMDDLPTFDNADSDDYTPAPAVTPTRSSRSRGKPTTSFAHLLLDESDEDAPLSVNVGNGKPAAKKSGPPSKRDTSPDILQSFRHSVVPSNRPGPASRKADVSPPVFATKTVPPSAKPGPKSRRGPREPTPPPEPAPRSSRGRAGPKSRVEKEPSPEPLRTPRPGPKSRQAASKARSVSRSRSPTPEQRRSRFDNFYGSKSTKMSDLNPTLRIEKLGASMVERKSQAPVRVEKSKSPHSLKKAEVILSRLEVKGGNFAEGKPGGQSRMGPKSRRYEVSPEEEMEVDPPTSQPESPPRRSSHALVPEQKKVARKPGPKSVTARNMSSKVTLEENRKKGRQTAAKFCDKELDLVSGTEIASTRAGPKSKKEGIKPVNIKKNRSPSPIVVEFSSDSESEKRSAPKSDKNAGVPQFIIDAFMSPEIKLKKISYGEPGRFKPGPKSKKLETEEAKTVGKPGPKSKKIVNEETKTVSKPGPKSKKIENEVTEAVVKPGPKSKQKEINMTTKATRPGPKSRTLKSAQDENRGSHEMEADQKAGRRRPGPLSRRNDTAPELEEPSPIEARKTRNGSANQSVLTPAKSPRGKPGPKSRGKRASSLEAMEVDEVIQPKTRAGSRSVMKERLNVQDKKTVTTKDRRASSNEEQSKKKIGYGPKWTQASQKLGQQAFVLLSKVKVGNDDQDRDNHSKPKPLKKPGPKSKQKESKTEEPLPNSPRETRHSKENRLQLGPKSQMLLQENKPAKSENEGICGQKKSQRVEDSEPKPRGRPGPKSRKIIKSGETLHEEKKQTRSQNNPEEVTADQPRGTRSGPNLPAVRPMGPKSKVEEKRLKGAAKAEEKKAKKETMIALSKEVEEELESRRTRSSRTSLESPVPQLPTSKRETTPRRGLKLGPKSKTALMDTKQEAIGQDRKAESTPTRPGPKSKVKKPDADSSAPDKRSTRGTPASEEKKATMTNDSKKLSSASKHALNNLNPGSKTWNDSKSPVHEKALVSKADDRRESLLQPNIVLSRVNVPSSIFKQTQNGATSSVGGRKRKRSPSPSNAIDPPAEAKKAKSGIAKKLKASRLNKMSLKSALNLDAVKAMEMPKSSSPPKKGRRGSPKMTPEVKKTSKMDKSRSPSPALSLASLGSVRSEASLDLVAPTSPLSRNTRARPDGTPSMPKSDVNDPRSTPLSSRTSRNKSTDEDNPVVSAFDAVANGSSGRRGSRRGKSPVVDPLSISSDDLNAEPSPRPRPGPASRRAASGKDKFEEAFSKLKENRSNGSPADLAYGPGKRKRGEPTPTSTSPKLPEKRVRATMGPRSAVNKRKRQESSDEDSTAVEIVEEVSRRKPAPKSARAGPASSKPSPARAKPGPASRTGPLKRKREAESLAESKKARLELLACSKDVAELVLEDILLAAEVGVSKSKTFAREVATDWIHEDLLGSVFAESTEYCSTVMDDVVTDTLFVLFGPPSSFDVKDDKNADKYLLALEPPKVKLEDCIKAKKMPFDATAILCRDILIDEVIYPAKSEVDSRFLNEMCSRVTSDIVEYALLDSTRHCAKNVLEDLIFDEACYRAMGPPKTLDLTHEKAPKIVDKLKCTLPLEDMFSRKDGKFPTEANGIFCMDILVNEVVYPAKDEIDDRFIEGVAKGQVETLLDMLFAESSEYCSSILDGVVDEAGYRLFGAPARLDLNHELAPMVLKKLESSLPLEDCFAKEPFPREATFSFCMDILVEDAVYPAKEEIDGNFIDKLCSGIVTHIVEDLVFAESAQYCRKAVLEDIVMDEAAYRLFGPPLTLPLTHVKAPKILSKLQNHRLAIEDCLKKPQMPREAVEIICNDLMDEIVLQTEEEIISRPFFKHKQVNDAIMDMLVAMPMKWKTIREREKWRLSVIADSIMSILLDVPKTDDFAVKLTATRKFARDMCFQIMVEDVSDPASDLFVQRKEAREAELRRPKPFSIRCKDLYEEDKLHPEASRFLGERTLLSIVHDAETSLAERPFFRKELVGDILGSLISESVAAAVNRKKEGGRKRGHSSSLSKTLRNSSTDEFFGSPASKRSRRTFIEEHDAETSATIVHDIKLECFSDSESSTAGGSIQRKRKRSTTASNLKGEALFESLFAVNGDGGANGFTANGNGDSNGIEILD